MTGTGRLRVPVSARFPVQHFWTGKVNLRALRASSARRDRRNDGGDSSKRPARFSLWYVVQANHRRAEAVPLLFDDLDDLRWRIGGHQLLQVRAGIDVVNARCRSRPSPAAGRRMLFADTSCELRSSKESLGSDPRTPAKCCSKKRPQRCRFQQFPCDAARDSHREKHAKHQTPYSKIFRLKMHKK